MKTPRWMPRSAIALAAVALGTLGLGLAVVPSNAQDSKAPPSEEPATPSLFPDSVRTAPGTTGTGSRTWPPTSPWSRSASNPST